VSPIEVQEVAGYMQGQQMQSQVRNRQKEAARLILVKISRAASRMVNLPSVIALR